MPGVLPEDFGAGAHWSWRGEAVKVDGPTDILVLGDAHGRQDMRDRAAKVVKKLVGATLANRPIHQVDTDSVLGHKNIVLTDGRNSYIMTLIDTPDGYPLAMFIDDVPPQGVDHWVVDVEQTMPRVVRKAPTSGIICFTGNTFLEGPDDPIEVNKLRPGDKILTRDSGLQAIQWVGRRRITGARLHIMPHLRPVRIKAGALDQASPCREVPVSPYHRILVKGRVAQDLFNTDEVLVAAKDLVNGRTIYHESRVAEVTYYHILFAQHEVMQADGVWCESFHPAHMDLSSLDSEEQSALYMQFPNLQEDVYSYGDTARRSLNTSEAALLQYAKTA
ncbi:MAG: Hint domain-containing protein [Planktomarina sp.]